MLRFLSVVITLIVFLIVSIPIVLLLLFIGLFSPRLRDYGCLRIVQGVFRFMLWISGTHITTSGLENVPTGHSVLYVCNHRSYFDILTTYVQCRRLTGYVSKDSMARIPMLNVWMKLLYCLFLDRDNPRNAVKTIKHGTELLTQGISVCIFPEGTRGPTEGALLPFKEGSVRMAKKADVPIVPVAISNTFDIWEKQFPKIRPASITITYGTPFLIRELPEEDKKFAAAYAQRQIQKMLDKNNNTKF